VHFLCKTRPVSIGFTSVCKMLTGVSTVAYTFHIFHCYTCNRSVKDKCSNGISYLEIKMQQKLMACLAMKWCRLTCGMKLVVLRSQIKLTPYGARPILHKFSRAMTKTFISKFAIIPPNKQVVTKERLKLTLTVIVIKTTLTQDCKNFNSTCWLQVNHPQMLKQNIYFVFILCFGP